MLQLPPIPTWDGLHPLIIHFPVGLLIAAPVVMILGLARPAWREGALAGAFAMVALGTVATYVAVATGEAAGRLADRTPEINAVLQRHESLAEATRSVFTIITVIFAAILALTGRRQRVLAGAPGVTILVVFLALYLGGLLALVNTAHNGGRLVHEFGVRAPVASGEPLPQADEQALLDQDRPQAAPVAWD